MYGLVQEHSEEVHGKSLEGWHQEFTALGDTNPSNATARTLKHRSIDARTISKNYASITIKTIYRNVTYIYNNMLYIQNSAKKLDRT